MEIDRNLSNWRDNSGAVYNFDNISDVIKSQSSERSRKVYIGTDSHRCRKGNSVAIATAICLWSTDLHDGGWYVFKRNFVPKKTFPSLYDRLFHEVYCSVETASFLRDEEGINVEEIHINVNPLESEKSSKYAAQLRGYVEGFGFKCILKPGDWAAGGVADKHAR